MAGIIKKQISKHLSRFTKNSSPDKINSSTSKGEGHSSNSESDEEVLQNMLDSPTWLAVTRVYCNKAAIRIQWTKLKTSPICSFLDKVEVEMRTCEEPRPPNGPSPIAITAGQSEYGFAEKVVEGMSVRINSITIKVQASAFHASFESWQSQGNSLNPKWQRSDLRYTRITDPKRGEVLTFKEINWQTLRIEADAIESDDQDLGTTPLRLITNQGRIRIALKRRIKDCNVSASKSLFILDDSLWVSTDSQLKAIIHYAKSSSEAMEKSAQQRKSMTAESLQTAPPSPVIHSLWTEPPPSSTSTANTISQYFDLHDVKESSYHTFISRSDLHICNDSSSMDEDEPPPPGLQGAMQLTFRKSGFDYYPIHRPADGCRHWERYSRAMEAQAQWAGKSSQEYQRRAEACGFPGPYSEGQARNSPANDGQTSPKMNPSDKEQATSRNSVTASLNSISKRLRSSCVVIRMDDVDIHQVSTRGRHNKKTHSLISCNRKVSHLPDNVPAVHLQFTEYYFPDNSNLPVPTSNSYVQLNSLQSCADAASLLWINSFSRGLSLTSDQVKAFYHLQDGKKAEEHVDIRVDAAQLKSIIPSDSSISDHPERPQSLSVIVPQMVFSNTRNCPHGSAADLSSTCEKFTSCSFFQPNSPCSYPRECSAFQPVPSTFLRHAEETEPQPSDRKRLRSQDIWSLSSSRVTSGFDGARRFPKGKTQPFIEPFAMSVWMCQPSAFKGESRSSPSCPDGDHRSSPEVEPQQDDASFASIHFSAHTITPLRMWLNHYQYVASSRMKDAMVRSGAELSRDLQGNKQTQGQKPKPPTVCLALSVDSVESGSSLPPASAVPEEEVPQTPETDSPSISDSDISPTHHSVDGISDDSVLENGISTVRAAAFDQYDQDGVVEQAYEAVEEEEVEENGLTTKEETPCLSPPLSPGPSPVISRESSTFSSEGELSSAISVTKDATKDAISASLDLTKGAFSITKDAFSMSSRGSGMSKSFSAQAREQNPRSEESSPTPRHQSSKHSHSQQSFDSAILDGSSPDENSSIDSDFSDNFVVLIDSESGAESLRPSNTPAGSRGSPAPGTEGGSSADLSSSLSQSTEDVSQDMSSVLLLISSGTACTMEVQGEDQIVAVQAQNSTPVQMGNVRLSDISAGLVQDAGEPAQRQDRQGCRNSAALSLRAEIGPSAAQRSASDESVGFSDVRLQDCQAESLASTVTNIGPFLEDEFSADGQPIRLHLSNITVVLKDDGPRIYPTAPQPVPAKFIIDQSSLQRSDDGIMRIKASENNSAEGANTKPSADVAAAGFDSFNGSDSVQHQSESRASETQLCNTQAALTQALTDKERLSSEIRKYDPTFTL